MSISHESVHEWWDGSRIDDSERLEVANAINDNSILEKAYNDLTQEQQDLVLNAYYQKQDYYNPNEEEELGVMSDHGSEDKGWTSYPAGTLSGRPLSHESQGLECPNCKNKGGLFESTFAKNGYICDHCDADITVEAIADWNDIDWLDVSDYIDKDKDARESKANEFYEWEDDELIRMHNWRRDEKDDPTLFLNEPVANRQELWDREVERYEYVIKLMSTMPPYEKPSKYDFMRGAENDEIAEAVWNMKQALGESKANEEGLGLCKLCRVRDVEWVSPSDYFCNQCQEMNESKASEDYLDDLGYDYAEPTYQQRMDARSVVTKNFTIVQKQTSVPEYGEDQWEYGSWDTFSEDYNMKCNICGRVFDTDADKNGVAEQHLRSEHSIDAFGVSHKQFKESYNPMAFINKQLGIKTKAKELSPEAQCPKCGSYKTTLEGMSSLGYGKRRQYVCTNCYNVFQSEYSPKEIRSMYGDHPSPYDRHRWGWGESKASEDYEHLKAEDEARLDRDIETLQTAFYREVEKQGVSSANIFQELSRLRWIKSQFESGELPVTEAVRGKWDSWKKQDADVRDETMDFADVSDINTSLYTRDVDATTSVRADMVNMTLDEIRKIYPEEYEKLKKTGVWGFGEVRAVENWTDDEWFAEIEKLASGSGVKRTPVENFLATIDNNDSIVQAEMNFVNDAEIYGWNEATRSAILKGIAKFFSRGSESKANEVWIDIFYYIQSKPQGVTYEELEEKFGDRSDFKYFLFEHILDGGSKKLAYIDGKLIKAHESKANEEIGFTPEQTCCVCGKDFTLANFQNGVFSQGLGTHDTEGNKIMRNEREQCLAHTKCLLAKGLVTQGELDKIGESKANEDDLMRGFFPKDEDYKTYQRSMDKALGLKSVDSHYKSDGITCGICGETPSDKREHLRKHYGAYFDETVASESKATEERQGVHILELPYEFFDKSEYAPHGKQEFVDWLINVRGYSEALAYVSMEEVYDNPENYKKATTKFTESKASEVVEVKGLCPNCGKEDIALTDRTISGINSHNMAECSNCGYQWTFKELSSFNEDPQTDLGHSKPSEHFYESKANEKTGYRKRPTGYGTYVYEEKSKINCQNCGKEIYETDGDTFHTTKCRYCGHVNLTNDLTYESEAKKQGKEVAEKLAYYFNRGEKPIDWTDNQVSNEAEKILQETYGITTKKPEVAKEVAHESHSPTQEKIIDRKLAGVKSDGIVHELMLWENMSEEQATKAVESTEIPVMDSVSFSLFNRKYSELNEVERQEIKLYGGEAKATEDFTVSPHPNLLSDYVKRYPSSIVAGDVDYPASGGHFFQGLRSGDLCEAWTRADLENREIMKEITGYSEEYLNKLCYHNKWGRSGTITDNPTEPYGLGEAKKVNKSREGV